MSHFTSALLSFGFHELEAERMAEVNVRLADLDQRGQQFRDGRDDLWYGGTKVMAKPLWGAAFNYVELDTVLEAVRAAAWEYPDEVQVFWCGEDDYLWTLHPLTGA